MSKFFTFSRIRLIFALILFGVLIYGTVSYVGLGTICAYCPVGILQTGSASLSFTITMVVTILIVIILVSILGRAFCSWGCPTAYIRKVAGVKHSVSCADAERKPKSKIGRYSAYGVLIAAIIGSFFVGFPLFCLVCPVGLFFGTIFALHRLFVSYQPGWELLIFPIIIILEILVFRSWCSVICPIGAFFKLINKVTGRFIKVKSNPEKCKQLQGGRCRVCSTNCDENINVPDQDKEVIGDCSLCLKCKDKCPHGAINISVKR